MKKIKTLLIAACLCVGMVYTAFAGGPVLGEGGFSDKDGGAPVVVADEELEAVLDGGNELTPYAVNDAPDWLSNTHMPAYEELKKNYSAYKYDKIYSAIYAGMYNFGVSDSAKLLYYSDGRAFLLVDLTDIYTYEGLFGSGVFSGNENIYNDVYTIAKALRSENPQFYYEGGMKMIFLSSNRACLGIEIVEDFVSGDARMAENERISQTVESYDKAVKGLSSNYLIEKTVHDRICAENTYAYQSDGTTPEDADYAHSIVGIVDPSYVGAVCEGYAKSMLFFLNRYNVPCFYLAGYLNGDNNSGHAWNCVMLDDGEYHAVDATWDDGKMTTYSGQIYYIYYEYFNKPAKAFYEDDGRDNSSVELSQIIPAMSENGYFYNADYETKNIFSMKYTTDEFGNRVYPAPTVTYAQKKINANESTLSPSGYPGYTGSFSKTTQYDNIVASGSELVSIGDKVGIWSTGRYSGSIGYISTKNGSISFLTEKPVYFTMKAAVNSAGTLKVYIDGKEVAAYEASVYYNNVALIIPPGRHRITMEYSGNGSSNAVLYDVNVRHTGDVNKDGKLDLTDAVKFLAQGFSASSHQAEYMEYDVDGNSLLDNADVAYILKEIANG